MLSEILSTVEEKINLKLKNQTSVVWFFWSTFKAAE